MNYKRDYQKIAMGFLSFEDDLKNLANLKTEFDLYTNDEGHELYLYKETSDVNCNFSGVVGLETGADYVLVRHLDMSPANRTDQDYFAVLDDLSALVGAKKIMGSIDVTPVIMRWEEAKKG
ncbi:N-acetyltransferase [Lacticaseibacillus hulanensis]|uniref:N-acetyltransferase n=1 Tax=Lacticaseibacillus hulanensis TaxID=2493111 RepID=UPI001F4D9428|nr:N-acetyltransferase [Lacticaseibacillus hulanensis]